MELLAAITTFFARVGLTSADVGIKVSSRKVLQQVLQRYGVPAAAFGSVCVVVDKMEKIPREKVGAGGGRWGGGGLLHRGRALMLIVCCQCRRSPGRMWGGVPGKGGVVDEVDLSRKKQMGPPWVAMGGGVANLRSERQPRMLGAIGGRQQQAAARLHRSLPHCRKTAFMRADALS